MEKLGLLRFRAAAHSLINGVGKLVPVNRGTQCSHLRRVGFAELTSELVLFVGFEDCSTRMEPMCRMRPPGVDLPMKEIR